MRAFEKNQMNTLGKSLMFKYIAVCDMQCLKPELYIGVRHSIMQNYKHKTVQHVVKINILPGVT